MNEASKQTEESPRHSEQKYLNLFEAANDVIMIFEPDQEIILEVNRRASEIYGYDRETLIGMSLKTLTQDIVRGEEMIRRVLQ
jgi:PAS domain S-box-containing protein